jgi:integrase
MAHRTRQIKRSPIERFPLKPRRDGRFAKRILGHVYYFGKDADRKAAMAEYDRVKYQLYEGRRPKPSEVEQSSVTIKELAGLFLDEKDNDVKAGRITVGTYKDLVAALFRFYKRMGASRVATDLGAEDFRSYARFLKSKVGPHAFNRERACIASMFNMAAECEWVDRHIKLGSGFKKASAGDLRQIRRRRLVPAGVIQACLREAKPQMRAMILLGALGGYGAMDCARLKWEHVDLARRIIRFARPKTKIERETPLSAETVEALQLVRAERPKDDLVFRTVHGNPWVNGLTDAVGAAWVKLQDRLQIPVTSPFYDLRHTFATHANETKDRDARERIMGHALRGLDDVYVEAIFETRLRAVVDHVRRRLLAPSEMIDS